MANQGREVGGTGAHGIALILVMLAMLILSVLAAGIVFTARSETLASHSFSLNTEADYLAKAGIQQTVNWFRSTHYARDPVSGYPGLPESQAATYYNVDPGAAPYFLRVAMSEPVQCIGASPLCTAVSSPVQLCGYAAKASAQLDCTSPSDFPNIYDTETTPRPVTTAFASDLVNVRVTGDAGDSGTFSINAYLLSYQTVNQGVTPPYTRVPLETWLITSKATWTGSSSSNAALATAEEQAVIQPIYLPNWGDAMYAYCDVTMQGAAQDCVDSFNSALGQYGGGNTTALHTCDDTNAPNVITNGGSIGANGGVILGSNITVGGNVVIGSNPTAGCAVPSPPFYGTTTQVSGQVVNGSYVPPSPVPTFRSGFPGTAPSYSKSSTLPDTATWPNMTPPASPPAPPPWPGYNSPLNSAPPLGIHSPCMDTSCDGTTAHPYEITKIDLSGNNKIVQLSGGPDIFHPVVYDIDTIVLTGNSSQIDVSGYVVLNVQTSASIKGSGITNGVAGTVDIPPAAVSINVACSGSCVSIGGNGAISALINAPLADVSLGGGGNSGYFVGAIQANNISDQGHYPIHYDVQLGGRNLGGTVSVPITTSYTRRKM